MNCPICGAELQDGSTWCPTCGSSLDPAQQMVQPQQQMAPVNNLFNQDPMAAVAPAPKKSPVAAIIIALVCVLALGAVAFFTLGKGGKNGTYELSEVSAMGMTFSADEFAQMSGQELKMSIKVKGSKCEVSADMADMGAVGSGSAKIKFSGDKVTISSGSEELEGKYDAKKKTITITASGVDMVFKKK